MGDRFEKSYQGPSTLCKNDDSSAVRQFLPTVGDKWSILLLVTLAKTPRKRARFSEIQRMLEGISQRMLTTTLRNLEKDGLISREAFPEVPPRVEYELTGLGLSLLEPMEQLVRWIVGNWKSMRSSRESFRD